MTIWHQWTEQADFGTISEAAEVEVYMSNSLTVVSVCSGIGGLDLGLERAGFETRVMVEIDSVARETIRLNERFFRRRPVPIFEDLSTVESEELLQRAGLRPGEPTLLAGGLPCQSYSTAGRRESIRDPRGLLFFHFMRLLRETQPRFALIENVRGLKSAAIRHRPLNQRTKWHPPLSDDEQPGSAFRLMIDEIEASGYQVISGLANSADYGVPQVRERLVILMSRDHEIPEDVSEPTKLMRRTHRPARWVTLDAALRRAAKADPTYTPYSPARAAIYRMIPEGGNWRYLRDRYGEAVARGAMGGAYDASGGKVGFFRRLSRGRPAPTLPTSPVQLSTGLCHPDELRPLSVEEYAAIQQFPPGYRFTGPVSTRYRHIGNAVPVGLGRALGWAIRRIAAHTSARVIE